MPAKELHTGKGTSAYMEDVYKIQSCHACGSGCHCQDVAGVFAQEIPYCSLLEGSQAKFLPGLCSKESFAFVEDLALLLVCFTFWILLLF